MITLIIFPTPPTPENCKKCGVPISLEDFFKSMIKKIGMADASALQGVQIQLIPVIVEEGGCENLTPLQECNKPMSLEEMFQSSCSIDSCGNLIINVLESVSHPK